MPINKITLTILLVLIYAGIHAQNTCEPTIDCTADNRDIHCLELSLLSAEDISLYKLSVDSCNMPLDITIFNTTTEAGDCSSPQILRSITSDIQGIYGGGQRTEVCTRRINILRFDTIDNGALDFPGTLILPKSFVIEPDISNNEMSPFSCSGGFIEDVSGLPAPIAIEDGGSGYPILQWTSSDDSIRHTPLVAIDYKNGDDNYNQQVDDLLQDCALVINYEDDIQDLDCKMVGNRLWTICAWTCDGQQCLSFLQNIVIQDNQPPIISEYIEDKTYTVSNSDCSRTVYIETPQYVDSCQNGASLIIEVFNQEYQILATGVSGFFNFPLGINKVVYTYSDNCLNTIKDTSVINIVDQTSPVVLCNNGVTVSLTDSLVHIPAHVFDNGSFDACLLDRICVTRMSDLILFDELDSDSDGEILLSDFEAHMATCYTDYSAYAYQKDDGLYYLNENSLCLTEVAFCCEDSNQDDLLVAFKAFDSFGNSSLCMVPVEVQDKQKPEIYCLPDITIECDLLIPDFSNFYPNITLDPLSELFGSVVQASDVRRAFEVPASYVVSDFDTTTYQDGYVFDHCDTPRVQVTIIDNRTMCGQGYIERRIEAIKGNIKSDLCIQRINIIRSTTFDDLDTLPTVHFSCFLDIDSLDNNGQPHPHITGYPTWNNGRLVGNCNEVKNTYSDEIIELCGNNSKIIRTWILTDWCNDNITEFNQIIDIYDNIAPSCTVQDTINYSLNDNGIAQVNLAELIITLEDRCSPSFNICVTSKNKTNCFVGRTDLSNNLIDFDCNDIGINVVEITVEDACGNKNTCKSIINIEDKIPPIIICPNDTFLSCFDNVDGAIDFLNQSVEVLDNCSTTPSISFSRRTFLDSCNQGEIFVDVLAVDESGNNSFCTWLINIDETQPQFDFPEDTISYLVSCVDDIIESPQISGPSIISDCPNSFIIDENPEETIFKDKNGNDSLLIINWLVRRTCNNTIVENFRQYIFFEYQWEDIICEAQSWNINQGGVAPREVGSFLDDCEEEHWLEYEPSHFDCSQLGKQDVIVSVVDLNEDVLFKCTTTIEVTDNSGFCPCQDKRETSIAVDQTIDIITSSLITATGVVGSTEHVELDSRCVIVEPTFEIQPSGLLTIYNKGCTIMR